MKASTDHSTEENNVNSSVIDLSAVTQRQEVVPVSQASALITVIERAARDPSIDIDKMERLLAMQEKIFARNAETDFNVAMAACQAEMPRIVPTYDNTQTNSKYAALEEIDRVARPIYTKHGFALSFGTADCPTQGWYRQTCKVSHRGGHSEMHHADLPPDLTGIKGTPNKTGVQGFGSTMSYGQRYITKLVFNIVVGGEDNDGNGELLSVLEIGEIEKLIADSGTNKQEFLKYWRIDSLEKMPAFNFPVIQDMLLARKARRGTDPRGDTSGVDFALRDKHVSAITDILNSDKEEADIADMLRGYVTEFLQPFPELWITVGDKLATDKIISKANMRKYLSLNLNGARER